MKHEFRRPLQPSRLVDDVVLALTVGGMVSALLWGSWPLAHEALHWAEVWVLLGVWVTAVELADVVQAVGSW